MHALDSCSALHTTLACLLHLAVGALTAPKHELPLRLLCSATRRLLKVIPNQTKASVHSFFFLEPAQMVWTCHGAPGVHSILKERGGLYVCLSPCSSICDHSVASDLPQSDPYQPALLNSNAQQWTSQSAYSCYTGASRELAACRDSD